MRLRERVKKLKIDLPAVFLALKAPQTPVPAKVFAALTVAYALSPVDLIPDFIPIFGYLDDLLILPLLLTLTLRCIPKEQMAQYRAQAEGLWDGGKPKKWYYAIPVVLIWGLALWRIAAAVLR